jgi:hypothetical protein
MTINEIINNGWGKTALFHYQIVFNTIPEVINATKKAFLDMPQWNGKEINYGKIFDQVSTKEEQKETIKAWELLNINQKEKYVERYFAALLYYKNDLSKNPNVHFSANELAQQWAKKIILN